MLFTKKPKKQKERVSERKVNTYKHNYELVQEQPQQLVPPWEAQIRFLSFPLGAHRERWPPKENCYAVIRARRDKDKQAGEDRIRMLRRRGSWEPARAVSEDMTLSKTSDGFITSKLK